jgi:hypothetical protein
VLTGSGCTGALFASAGTFAMSNGGGRLGSVAASNAVVMSPGGVFSWQAVYSGDADYNPATICVDQTIGMSTPTITLSVSPSPGV